MPRAVPSRLLRAEPLLLPSLHRQHRETHLRRQRHQEGSTAGQRGPRATELWVVRWGFGFCGTDIGPMSSPVNLYPKRHETGENENTRDFVAARVLLAELCNTNKGGFPGVKKCLCVGSEETQKERFQSDDSLTPQNFVHVPEESTHETHKAGRRYHGYTSHKSSVRLCEAQTKQDASTCFPCGP